MEETTNLKLKKPDRNDRYNVKDFNDNFDAIDGAINRSNSTKEITLTATNWQGVSAPYTQQISVPGVTEHDVPIGSAKIEKGATVAVKKAAECIDGLETGNGTITFYCNRKKPIADVTVILKGVE